MQSPVSFTSTLTSFALNGYSQIVRATYEGAMASASSLSLGALSGYSLIASAAVTLLQPRVLPIQR